MKGNKIMTDVQVLHHPSPVIGSSSLMGYVDTTYAGLVDTFGEPTTNGDGYKSRAQWILRTPSGVAYIYDYKENQPIEDVIEWHVGGNDPYVVEHVRDALDGVLDVRK